MRNLRVLALIAVLVGLGGMATPALAAQTQVAVSANFTEPARTIAQAFERASGHKAVLSFGASGQFYAQIVNGAPFQVFLSADAERPRAAEAAGLAVAGTRFTYATGRLALYSHTSGLVDGQSGVLRAGRFDKLAIADPKTSPYGAAAIETLEALGLFEALRPRLVRGASITQAYQFVRTGAAELGLVALSQVVAEPVDSRWVVPAANHSPIEQQAVLLKAGAANTAAGAFLAFLAGPEARAVIRRYGYEAP